MAVMRAVEAEGPQRTPATTSGPPEGQAALRPPPLPSARVAGAGSARGAEGDEPSSVKLRGSKPRDADPDAAREWALRAAETKARIEAAEEREWLAQLARVKAAQADDEEAEWRALRAKAAAAEQREWEVAIARARAAVSISTPNAKPAARAVRPPKPSSPGMKTPAAPTLAKPSEAAPGPSVAPTPVVAQAGLRSHARGPASTAPSAPAVAFTPFGHVAHSAPPARGHVVAWP